MMKPCFRLLPSCQGNLYCCLIIFLFGCSWYVFPSCNASNSTNTTTTKLEFWLVDVATHQLVRQLFVPTTGGTSSVSNTNTSLIYIQELVVPSIQNINIVAKIIPPTPTTTTTQLVKSLRFQVTGTGVSMYSRLETGLPYALCGDTNNGTTYRRCTFFPMNSMNNITFTINAKGYSQANGTGTTVVDSTIAIKIVNYTITSAPTVSPVIAPTTQQQCGIPKFEGDWQPLRKLPIEVAESHGGMIGNSTFLMVSGFVTRYINCTTSVWSLDVSNVTTTASTGAQWQRVDDYPLFPGISHGAYAIHGTKLFMCGGFIGAEPGQATGLCYQYDHAVAPNGTSGQQRQWTTLPTIPDGGRGGAGLVYHAKLNVLAFATGAKRPVVGSHQTVDYNTTWVLNMTNMTSGWVRKADSILVSNHVSFVTAYDQNNLERTYFLGGQTKANELNGNHDDVYEYDIFLNQWILRTPMPFSRGHASSSTFAYGCGYIIAGGVINDVMLPTKSTNDVSYYDIPTNTWYHVGTLPNKPKTPVCDYDPITSYMHCIMPLTGGSYRRKIILTSYA